MSDPVVWVTGLDDCKVNGFVDAMAYRHGEFTTPLYSQHEIDRLTAELAKARKIIAEQDGMLGRRPCGDNRCVKLIAANKRADEARAVAIEETIVRCIKAIERLQENFSLEHGRESYGSVEYPEGGLEFLLACDNCIELIRTAVSLATVPAGHQVVPVDLLEDIKSDLEDNNASDAFLKIKNLLARKEAK